MTDKYDFFVSYAREDNKTGWITNFINELLAEHRRFAAGRELTHFFDKNEISIGADWQHTLNHGIAHSRLFIAFVSPNYFRSEWCRKEWRAWIDAEIAKHIFTAGVRPVYIVEVPGLTDGNLSEHDFSIQFAELLQLPEEASAKLVADTPAVVKHLRRRQLTHNQPSCDVHSFFQKGIESLRRDDLRQVLNQLAKDLDDHAKLLKGAEASASTIPPYNRNFSGRLEELLTLRESLDKDDRTGIIYGVHGLGGIGKTELALTYAHGYASAYPGGRFLIKCDGKSSLRDAILTQHDFTCQFDDRISDDQRKDLEEYYAAVRRQLSLRLESLGHILLLLDNVTDVSILSPEQTDKLTSLGPQLHLLATTRQAPSGDSRNWISLDRLPPEDAIDLLEKHRQFENEEERKAAQAIVNRLGGFTLALELVAAWLAVNKESSSYARVAKYVNIAKLDEIADDAGYELRRHNQQRRLGAVLGPVIETLKPAARRALEYAAFLPPDHIPLSWLRALVTNDFPELADPDQLKDPWDALWHKLEKLSLFSRTTEKTHKPRLVRVHRLVQELVREDISEAARESLQGEIYELVMKRCEALKKVTQWQDARWELDSLAALANIWADNRDPKASWLLNQAGAFTKEVAQWYETEWLLRRALAIDEQTYGPDHPAVAQSLNNLAYLLSGTNRRREAEPLYRRALVIREQNYGPAHPTVATSLNGLARLLSDTNRVGEAEPLYRRALLIREQSYGQDHPEVASILHNLTYLLIDTNRLGEAEPLCRRALAIDEQCYGPDHPDVAVSLSILAGLLIHTNRLCEAEQLYRRALAIDEQCYGPDHPNVASHLHNLAHLFVLANRMSEAEPLYRRALEIHEQSYGQDHPAVALDLTNLAGLLTDTDSTEAESLYRRALEIYEHSYGPEHPDVALTLNDLAGLLSDTDRESEAESLCRRALVIREQSYGQNHPDVATSLNNLAHLLSDTDRESEAEPLYRRALEIYEQCYGQDHPDVALTLNDLAGLLSDTDRESEAEILYRRALAIFEHCHGPNHPNVGWNLDNLASLLHDCNRLDEAEPLYRRALMIHEQSYGLDHPDVATTLYNLADLLRETNRKTEAESLHRRTLAIHDKS